MITRPLLAVACEDINKLVYPVWATPKLDGIRALMINGRLVSRTFKPIPNAYIRSVLEPILRNNMDGELIVGKTFQECTSGVMSHDGEPDFKFYMFDWVYDKLTDPYVVRSVYYNNWYDYLQDDRKKFVVPLVPEILHNAEELLAYEAQCLGEGYEGVMVRSPQGEYKCGRSTLKQGILLKIKQFVDSEATVLSFEEKLTNENEQTTDAFGHAERSSCKAGMVPANTLGAVYVRDCKTGVEFHIGSGFDDATRKEVWQNQSKYLGKLVKYKYQPHGVKDKPRCPIFLGFRHEDDL